MGCFSSFVLFLKICCRGKGTNLLGQVRLGQAYMHKSHVKKKYSPFYIRSYLAGLIIRLFNIKFNFIIFQFLYNDEFIMHKYAHATPDTKYFMVILKYIKAIHQPTCEQQTQAMEREKVKAFFMVNLTTEGMRRQMVEGRRQSKACPRSADSATSIGMERFLDSRKGSERTSRRCSR